MTQSMIPVVLSGGSGTRLWPVSRASFPKQFCELFDESLLSKTLQRLAPLGSPRVLTVEGLRVLTDRTLKSLHLPFENAHYEPFGCNTAPAIALLCKILEFQKQTAAIVGVFPADQLIQDEKTFTAAVQLAQNCAEKGQIVTLGIRPTSPATGYGYIEISKEVYAQEASLMAHSTLSFREKPNLKTAEDFVARGTFVWNAGMFVFKASQMIVHFKKWMPELWAEIEKLKPDLTNLNEVYQKLPKQSIDYGIMEKVKEQVCIPCQMGWSDVGSWDEISRLMPSSSSTVVKDSENCFVYSKTNRAIGLIDVHDLIIVDSEDALLISKKNSTQKVKDIVDQLIIQKNSRAIEHPFEYRPWGKFEILRDTPHFKSKVILVDAGQQLSYQSHNQRAEHWVIIKGFPEVVLNDQVLKLKPGESVYIPQGAKHRIRNPGQEPVEFVEVQVGTYFGEDDIVRYQDDYKRK